MNDNIDTPAAAGPEAEPAPTEQAPQFRPADEIAKSLYERDSSAKPEVKPAEPEPSRAEIVKGRDTMERRFHSAEVSQKTVPVEQWIENSVAPEHRAAVAKEMREIYEDLSLRPEEVVDLNNVSQSIKEMPSAQTLAEWEAERARVPAEDVALARRLIARDPVVKTFFERNPLLAAHPVFVAKLAEAAARERSKGRLK